MTAIEGVIFDKDGTLFDFSRTWEAWAKGFLLRIAHTEDLARSIGHAIGFDVDTGKFESGSVVIAGTPGEIAEVMKASLPTMAASDIVSIMNEEAAKAPQVEAAELHPLLDRLKSFGLALGVVTNDAEEPAMAHLRSAGVQHHFDFVAGFDSGFGSKPQPGQLFAFLDHTGVEASRCVMVGDSTHDLLAGRQAGMWCVGVLTGLAEESVLSPHADVVLPDIGHLPEWLKQLNALN